MNTIKISAVLAVKNEEQLLEDCLKSLDWVDELVIIDTGSIDQTIKVAKKHAAEIVEYTNGKNFSDWRNKELTEAKGEWILYVDADERITPSLRKEIQTIIAEEKLECNAYAIPRRNIILGKELKHGGWYPDYQKRLFHREALKKWTGEVHEEPQFLGKLCHLKNPMVHIKHETFSQMVEKTNNWSTIEAQLMFDAKHPSMTIPRFMSAMFREFWQRMITKRAFLDGRVGISFALYQVFSRFISYAKLWELQLTNEKS